ncbi:MAG TPA: glycogen synthase GlgA [Candidatus Merdivicinus intestinavium]|nr:glycogen synthase GlgA [Candidatus Merdivicinus intestinavium]
MKILFAASEALPFIKVGGLGDVMGALPKELVKKGIDARVVIPMYSVMAQKMRDMCKFEKFFYFSLGWRSCYCGIFSAQADGVTYYLIDNEQYFKRGGTYGEFDDAERFAFFSKAVLEILPQIDFFPDIIHANDWHTALVPVYLDTQYRSIPGYGSIKTVFSIHNIEFQGKYDMSILESVFGIYPSQRSLLEFDGCINLMKGAIECSNIVTTVSRTYAEEILDPYFSFGLHPILEARKYKLHGIVNGIDTELFNPETDANIKTNYSVKTRGSKRFDKKALQQEVGLPELPNVPVLGLVTRLTPQKGIDLFEPILAELMEMDVQVVVLGNGYADYENYFKYCDYTYHDKFRAMIKFSAPLAQRIYAGADIFLMPSKSEPCGLAQMIAMRYGTIPVVHAVGGLKDTVIPFNPETGEGTGVTFQSFNAGDMLDAIRRAIDIWKDKEQRKAIMLNAMSGDYSWNASAEEYRELYESL